MKTGITRWAAGAALGCVLVVTGTAWGQTTSTDSVTDQIRQLRELVNKQQDQINHLTQTNTCCSNATITNDQRQEILALIKEELKDQKLPDWVNNLKITGDFRYRTEWIEKANTEKNMIANPPVAQNREETRQRIRARLGFFEQVNDEVTVGLQIATGDNTADPISANQTLGNAYPGFEKMPVWWDLAYADYHPKAVPGLNAQAGRVPNPFLEPGNSQLIWDSNLRMDGMDVKYKKQLCEGLTLFANAGGFWVSEGVTAGGSGFNPTQTTVEPDAMLWAAQGYATLAMPQLTKGAYATGGMSVYAYTHMQGVVNPSGFPTGGAGAPTVVGAAGPEPFKPSGGGNTLNPNGTLYSGFDIFNPFIEVGFEDPWLHKRLSFFGDFAYNCDAREGLVASPTTGLYTSNGNNAFAWLMGVTYGTLKNPGDWQVGYNYRRVGADSVIAMFDEADPAGGGTDYYGSKLTLAYQVAKGWQAAVSYFYDDITHADLYRESPSYQRLQFDLIFSF